MNQTFYIISRFTIYFVPHVTSDFYLSVFKQYIVLTGCVAGKKINQCCAGEDNLIVQTSLAGSDSSVNTYRPVDAGPGLTMAVLPM